MGGSFEDRKLNSDKIHEPASKNTIIIITFIQMKRITATVLP